MKNNNKAKNSIRIHKGEPIISKIISPVFKELEGFTFALINLGNGISFNI